MRKFKGWSGNPRQRIELQRGWLAASRGQPLQLDQTMSWKQGWRWFTDTGGRTLPKWAATRSSQFSQSGFIYCSTGLTAKSGS